MHRFPAIVLCLLTAAVAFAAEPQRVATYNIRFGSADDGPDAWPLRRDKVVETIEDLDADIVGLQEALPFQIAFLLEALPRYAAVGVSREDGRTEGEASPILYDRTRYTLAGAETFWLSDTPGEPSNTWGAACTRVCTRVRLVDLESGQAVEVFNTHFDHVSQEARERSARLIRSRLGSPPGTPVIVMGDFNAGEDNPAMETLRGPGSPIPLLDSYRAVHPEGPAGTFTGFRVDSDGGSQKIDAVLIGPGWRVRGAGIDRRKIEGRFPSDHFPVWAELEIAE
jgi:endonuclease/exonuclease/phosphatase family metal-dependent hydrolase